MAKPFARPDGTAEPAAEKSEKRIPRGVKPARNHNNIRTRNGAA